MLAGIRYPLSFTNLILIEEGTLALQKHYVNLNHYDTNIIHLIIVGLISSALTTTATVTEVAAHFFLVSLICLVLVGGHYRL